MRPVDLYLRVSRVGGREHMISPEEQERRARELLRERGIPAGRVLVDLDESGGKLDRPGLNEALRRVGLEPDPRTAPAIAEIFERRAGGEGPTTLARLLEERGVLTADGGRIWTRSSVMSVLSSRTYLGEISYGRDRRYVNASAHEPIVDLATWTAAQRPTRRVLRAPSGRGGYLLSGILRCAGCGYAATGLEARGKARYRCVRRHAAGHCPNPVSVYAEIVEPVAVALFWEEIGDLAMRGREEAADAEPLEEEWRAAERRLAQALTPEFQDAAGDAWATVVRERRAERDAAAEAVGRARSERRDGAPLTATLRKEWETMPLVDRRERIGECFDLLALRRGARGLELVPFPLGTGPNLARRGYQHGPKLRPILVPEGARVAPLQVAGEADGDRFAGGHAGQRRRQVTSGGTLN